MSLSLKSLSVGWLGGTGLVIVGGGGYLIYDFVNPIESQWLLGSGYILNPPKFTSHESEDYGCAENLFTQDTIFEKSKVYACKVIGLSISNDGDQVKDTSVDYLTFSSEYALRKGNQGWKIISRIDSRLGAIRHERITIYENKNNKWNPKQDTYIAPILRAAPDKKTMESERKKGLIQAISSENKFFQISFAGVELYRGSNNSDKELFLSSDLEKSKQEKLSEIHKESKYKSWIWVESNNGKAFSNSMSTFTRILPATEKDKYAPHETRALKSWLGHFYKSIPEKYSFFKGANEDWRSFWALVTQTTNTTKGKWVDAEEVCGLSKKRRWSVNEDQRTSLKVYCSKPKSEDQFLEISNQSSA